MLSASLWRYFYIKESERKTKEAKIHLISCVSGNIVYLPGCLWRWPDRTGIFLMIRVMRRLKATQATLLPRAQKGIARDSQCCLSREQHNIKTMSIANQYVFLQLEEHCCCSEHLSYSGIFFHAKCLQMKWIRYACDWDFHVIKTENMIFVSENCFWSSYTHWVEYHQKQSVAYHHVSGTEKQMTS